MCAVQTTDTRTTAGFYQDPLEASVCAGAVYTPTSKSGAIANGSGLPGHFASSGVAERYNRRAIRDEVRVPQHAPGRRLDKRETATVDTRGLPKVKGQTYHDIYLYVETHNMPYRVDAGYSPRTSTTPRCRIYDRSDGSRR